jgi:DNA polymerase II small subunit
LNRETINKKKLLIKKLIETNINISPSAFQFLLNIENPLEKLELIIKETSFIPTFKSNLTFQTLQSISNEEIQSALKRLNLGKFIKEEKQDLLEENPPNKAESKDQKKKDSKSSNIQEKQNNNITTAENKQIKKPNLINSTSIGVQKEVKAEIISDNNAGLYQPSEKTAQERKNITEKIKKMGSPISSLKFKPIAKEFDSYYEIKMDPTGKLFTSGEYEDFYNLTIDKFKKLKNLMRKRPEAHSATNISNIQKFSNKSEVSTIGLVKNIRKTKNDHYFFELEDLTGNINVLVRSDSDNRDLIRTVQKTINDQMLFVKGTYSFDKRGRDGIIFADNISKIDIPMEFKPVTSPEPLSVALISDFHIGSREFEESLLNKFLKFLKGKWGNKNQRLLAGRIKYIIINGDLIDGIGIYPNQKDDLVIPDIYDQFKKAAEYLSEIPDYIKVFYSSGNHEPVRNAIPRPAVPNKYCNELKDLEIEILGNPCMIQTHNVNSLVFHGDSLLDLNLTIPGLTNEKPADTMKELLICRHLAPSFGNKTQIAPSEKDWLVIDEVPQIFHTAHIHINGYGIYRGVRLINSGCLQSQTDFMKSFGIKPTPGLVPIIQLDTLENFELNLRNHD